MDTTNEGALTPPNHAKPNYCHYLNHAPHSRVAPEKITTCNENFDNAKNDVLGYAKTDCRTAG